MLPLPNGRTLWLLNGGDPITTYKSWDDPPSRANVFFCHKLSASLSCASNGESFFLARIQQWRDTKKSPARFNGSLWNLRWFHLKTKWIKRKGFKQSETHHFGEGIFLIYISLKLTVSELRKISRRSQFRKPDHLPTPWFFTGRFLCSKFREGLRLHPENFHRPKRSKLLLESVIFRWEHEKKTSYFPWEILVGWHPYSSFIITPI